MIFNNTHNSIQTKHQLNQLTGNPLGFWKRLRNLNLSFQKYLVIDGNDELIELLGTHHKLPYCRIELREKGIILWFRIGKDMMSLPLPYYSLTVFKGSEYFQVYGGKWRVKLAITKQSNNNRELIRQILLSKHANTSDFTQYYG